MSEYLVKYKVSVSGFLFSKSVEETMVIRAPAAESAVEECKKKIELELMGEIDLDEVTFSVIDVRKI
jgi:hypothetical protein